MANILGSSLIEHKKSTSVCETGNRIKIVCELYTREILYL